jgi:hypothetical protein
MKYLPSGTPRYIHCYDNGGKTTDRYTVVYTRIYGKIAGVGCWYIGMSADPTSPQGFGQHGESVRPIDRPKYSHLGKKIKFSDLPADCQAVVLSDYKALWGEP